MKFLEMFCASLFVYKNDGGKGEKRMIKNANRMH